MSHEIEAKIKVADLKPIAATLEATGAAVIHDIHQIDTYYMDAEGRLAKNDCGLRIRRQWSESEYTVRMTFKGAKLDSPYKSRPEFETGVENAETVEKIFEALGYKKHLAVEKKRSLWMFDNCEVCLDNVTHLGCFVEVEGPDEVSIAGVLAKLKLENEPVVKQGYASMTAQRLKQENA
ncbi:MAG: class IV adenylate cyclase [Planctomycetota bacterium]|jgi:adenylate cyclase class 2